MNRKRTRQNKKKTNRMRASVWISGLSIKDEQYKNQRGTELHIEGPGFVDYVCMYACMHMYTYRVLDQLIDRARVGEERLCYIDFRFSRTKLNTFFVSCVTDKRLRVFHFSSSSVILSYVVYILSHVAFCCYPSFTLPVTLISLALYMRELLLPNFS